jgi:uncharacterized protein
MNRFQRAGVTAIVALAMVDLGVAKQGNPELNVVSIYDTGLGANGAEIVSVRHHGDYAAITNVAGSIDLLDISDPFNPVFLRRVPIDTTTGTPNSVAIHPHHDYFLVAIGRAGSVGTVAAYRLEDGEFLASAPAGIQPDSINISPNGKYAVIANEAEATGIGQDGGPGSISVIELSGFSAKKGGELVVTPVTFPSLAGISGISSGRTDDLARLPITNAPPTIEPESVAFSHDSRYTFVTLQENNAVARLELDTLQLTVFGLGQTTHQADLTVNGLYQPAEILTAFREADGIALDRTGKFFVTADEGDTRNAAGASSIRGGRTVSIFDAETGAFIADTGSQLDDLAADPDSIPDAALDLYPDDRSNRGSTEPEVLDLTHHRGRTLVAVGLERANAIALVDVTEPTNPEAVAIAPVGVGPEGVKFFRSGSKLFVITASEVAGTVSILEVTF